MADVSQQVIDIFYNNLDLPSDTVISEETTFEDLGLDRLDVFEVMVGLEMSFFIRVPDDVVQSLDSVGATISYVKSTVNKGGS